MSIEINIGKTDLCQKKLTTTSIFKRPRKRLNGPTVLIRSIGWQPWFFVKNAALQSLCKSYKKLVGKKIYSITTFQVKSFLFNCCWKCKGAFHLYSNKLLLNSLEVLFLECFLNAFKFLCVKIYCIKIHSYNLCRGLKPAVWGPSFLWKMFLLSISGLRPLSRRIFQNKQAQNSLSY